MSDEQISCNCDYCISGPYYEDGLVIHWCEYCHEEFVDDETGCPGCEAYDRAMHKWKEDRSYENN